VTRPCPASARRTARPPAASLGPVWISTPSSRRRDGRRSSRIRRPCRAATVDGTVTFNLYNNPNGTGRRCSPTRDAVGRHKRLASYTTTAAGPTTGRDLQRDANNSIVSSGTAEPVTISRRPRRSARPSSGVGDARRFDRGSGDRVGRDDRRGRSRSIGLLQSGGRIVPLLAQHRAAGERRGDLGQLHRGLERWGPTIGSHLQRGCQQQHR